MGSTDAGRNWTVLSSASRVRQYHSSATLLPDGRVLTGGGGVCASCVSAGYLEKNIEYFEPPYLYKKDGSGQKASRPVIDNAPATATYDQDFEIDSDEAASIAKVGLVRLGAATHSQDQGQRYVPLNFTRSGSTDHRDGAQDLQYRAGRLLHALHYRRRWRSIGSQDDQDSTEARR